MESRLYYDQRAAEVPSGIFDLRHWPPHFQRSLVKLANRHVDALGLTPVVLDGQGFAWCPEPPGGFNPRWSQGVFALQRELEVAVGSGVPMLSKIERIYRLNFPVFTPPLWAELATLFGAMPEWRGATPYPRWFGDRDGPPPFLWGAIERTGLRTRGILSYAAWVGWDTWLRRNLDSFPLLDDT